MSDGNKSAWQHVQMGIVGKRTGLCGQKIIIQYFVYSEMHGCTALSAVESVTYTANFVVVIIVKLGNDRIALLLQKNQVQTLPSPPHVQYRDVEEAEKPVACWFFAFGLTDQGGSVFGSLADTEFHR